MEPNYIALLESKDSRAAIGSIFHYMNGTVFIAHFAKGSLRYIQTVRFPNGSKEVCFLSRPKHKKLPKEFPVFWARTVLGVEPIPGFMPRVARRSKARLEVIGE